MVLSLVDVRTTEQILSVSGEAIIKDKDWNVLANANSALSSGQVNTGNWNNTEIGKVIKQAYENTYKQMILEIGKKDLLAKYGDQKTYSSLPKPIQTLVAPSKPTASIQTIVELSQPTALVQTLVETPKTVELVQTNVGAPEIPEPDQKLIDVSTATSSNAKNNVKTFVLKRHARIFNEANINSESIGDIKEGMLVYPLGESDQNMLKVEDEKGRVGWISSTLLNAHR